MTTHTDSTDTSTKVEKHEKPVNIAPSANKNVPYIRVVREGDVKVSYSKTAIAEFLDIVFHTDTGGKILIWNEDTNRPSYPKDKDWILENIETFINPQTLYFGTATCDPSPKDGIVYNRKSLFTGLHVVVLDDIGTKIPLEQMPEDLRPTYIIESSEGNYQWGFVLDTPITELPLAEALIQLVYDSGYSDAGGKMPTKIVRLPGGVNGKKGEKEFFPVNLVTSDGYYWTPQELLDALKVNVDWSAIEADVDATMKSRADSGAGLTSWSPQRTHSASTAGIVDPVLEWLYENNKVEQETEHWATTVCPWCDQHTEEDGTTAGYSPMGRGDGEHLNQRGFNCFHAHCKDRSITDFLRYVAAAGGPEMPVHENVPELTATWAYDPSENAAWEIKRDYPPRAVKMDAFRNLYPQKVKIWGANGKSTNVPEASLWLNARNRVTVKGRIFDPSVNARIVDRKDGAYINTFTQPIWPDITPEQRHIDMFLNFLAYLIPGDTERAYFVKWLAAKVQDIRFRGAAIVMIALEQGTGRTTLADMLGTLFGNNNLERLSFDRMVGEGQFNEWQEKPLVISDETLNVGSNNSNTSYYKAYERLKDIVDPRPKLTRINPKYGSQRMAMVYSSYLMFSNHINAIAAAGNDRRLYILRNAYRPESPEYFTRLNDWLCEGDDMEKPEWAKSVWQYLAKLEVDVEKLMSPAPTTEIKQEMHDASKSVLDIAISAALDAWVGPYVNVRAIKDIIEGLACRVRLDTYKRPEVAIDIIMRQHCTGMLRSLTVRHEDRVFRPQIIRARIPEGDLMSMLINGPINHDVKANIRAQVRENSLDDIREKVIAALDLHNA